MISSWLLGIPTFVLLFHQAVAPHYGWSLRHSNHQVKSFNAELGLAQATQTVACCSPTFLRKSCGSMGIFGSPKPRNGDTQDNSKPQNRGDTDTPGGARSEIRRKSSHSHSLRIAKGEQQKSELIVILDKNDDKREVEQRLKCRGFTVPVMQENFCGLRVGSKLTRKLALRTEILPDEDGFMPVGHRTEIVQEAMEVVVQSGVATADRVFLAHDHHRLDAMKKKKSALSVDDVREYFGSGVGLYFQWVNTYRQALLYLSVICGGLWFYEWQHDFRKLFYKEMLRQKLASGESDAFLSVDDDTSSEDGTDRHAMFIIFFAVVAVWSCAFTESWKRAQADLAFRWNNLGKFQEDQMVQRAKGLKNKTTPQTISFWQKIMIIYLGYGVTVGLNFYVVMYIQKWMDEQPGMVPTIVASVWPLVGDFINTVVAPIITHLEGHETKASRDQALLTEKFAFSFVNYYGTVLFAAFWKRDLPRARSLVFSFLVTKQAIAKVVQIFFSHYKSQIQRLQKKISKKAIDVLFPQVTRSADMAAVGTVASGPEVTEKTAEEEKNASDGAVAVPKPLISYPDKTHESYESVGKMRKEIEASDVNFETEFLDSLVHYGYIAMFTSIFPLAPVLELVYTLVDLRMDRSAVLEARRTPFVRREILLAPSALAMISFLACLCNVGLLWVTLEEEPKYRDQLARTWTDSGARSMFGDLDFNLRSTRLIFVIVIEHILLLSTLAVAHMVRDEPEHVTDARAKKHHRMFMDSWKVRQKEAHELDYEELSKTALDEDKEKKKKEVAEKIAPTFGIPANALFPMIASCIVICYLDAMPFGLSELWLIAVMFIVLGYFSEKKSRIDREAAIGLVSDPHLVAMIAKEMPNWHKFQSTERCEWLNVILGAAWPYVNKAVSEHVKDEVIAPLLAPIPGLRMTAFRLGTVPLKCVGLSAAQTGHDAVHLDLDIKWASQVYARLELGVKGVPLPIELEDLQFSATLRVTAKPLVAQLNPLGGLEITFMEKPNIHFGFSVGKLDAMSLNLPHLRIAQQVKDLISGILENLMVYPTQLLVYDNMAGNSGIVGALLKPMPLGILEFEIVEAHNLPRMDYSFLKKKTTSDPYVTWMSSEYLSTTKSHKDEKGNGRQTDVIKKNHLNPKWNEKFTLLVHDPTTASITFSIFDYDMKIGSLVGQDDLIGKHVVHVKSLNRYKFGETTEEPVPRYLQLAEGVEDEKIAKIGTPTLTLDLKFMPLFPVNKEYADVIYQGDVDDSVILNDEIQSPRATAKSVRGQAEINSIGVLAVRGICVAGMLSSLHHKSDSIYVVITVPEAATEGRKGHHNQIEKTEIKNFAERQDFLEAFYFIVRHSKTMEVELKVMKREGKLRQAAQVMSNVATLALSDYGAAEDRLLGTVTYPIQQIIKDGGKSVIAGGTKYSTFTDSTGHTGDISYSLEYVQAQGK